MSPIPQTSNWSGTFFCCFLQQTGSNYTVKFALASQPNKKTFSLDYLWFTARSLHSFQRNCLTFPFHKSWQSMTSSLLETSSASSRPSYPAKGRLQRIVLPLKVPSTIKVRQSRKQIMVSLIRPKNVRNSLSCVKNMLRISVQLKPLFWLGSKPKRKPKPKLDNTFGRADTVS